MADAVHQRMAAVAFDHVLDRMAGAQVVDDRCAGVLQEKRFGQEGRDEVARHELAGPVERVPEVLTQVGLAERARQRYGR